SEEPGDGVGVFETGYEAIPVLEDLVRLGHGIGNHTLNHPILRASNVREQLVRNQEGIDQIAGPRFRMFRAPGGLWDSETGSAFDRAGLSRELAGPVRWDVDAKDWEGSRFCRSTRPEVECERAGPRGSLRVKPRVVAQRYLEAIESAGRGIVLL